MTQREKAITLLGGKCVKCGTVNDLEFDHINPLEKTLSISVAFRSRQDVLDKELSKCQLLCGACHKLKTIEDRKAGLIRPRERTTSSFRGYKKGCRCHMYETEKKEQHMKENPPQRRKIPSKRFIFQRWYFWSKQYLKDNE